MLLVPFGSHVYPRMSHGLIASVLDHSRTSNSLMLLAVHEFHPMFYNQCKALL